MMHKIFEYVMCYSVAFLYGVMFGMFISSVTRKNNRNNKKGLRRE